MSKVQKIVLRLCSYPRLRVSSRSHLCGFGISAQKYTEVQKKYPLQHIAATDTYYYWTAILLIQDSVQALVDACAQCAELVDFRSVLAANEVA